MAKNYMQDVAKMLGVELEEVLFPGSPGPPAEISVTREASSPGPAASAGTAFPRLASPKTPANASARQRFIILSVRFIFFS